MRALTLRHPTLRRVTLHHYRQTTSWRHDLMTTATLPCLSVAPPYMTLPDPTVLPYTSMFGLCFGLCLVYVSVYVWSMVREKSMFGLWSKTISLLSESCSLCLVYCQFVNLLQSMVKSYVLVYFCSVHPLRLSIKIILAYTWCSYSRSSKNGQY